ncbi:MAG: universal stress protein, partial [Gemmatimonadales bacterium]|nr:universal stress protein [Gemmatimonadales bacterium]
MFDSILVPLDGSRFAEAALPLATGLARSAHGKIRLALVHQPEMVAAGEGEESLGFGMVPIAESASERGYLAEIAASLGTNGDPRLTEILGGAPGPSLSEGISARHPDLVVLATHGWGPLARLWEEGVSSHLIRELSIPLLLVPPAGRSAMGDNWTCRRILVPLDLSGSSREILGPAQTLARLTQSHLTLVHVVEPMLCHGDPDLSASP